MKTETYLTEWDINGHLFGGRIEAGSWEAAARELRKNGERNEVVIGVLTREDRGTGA